MRTRGAALALCVAGLSLITTHVAGKSRPRSPPEGTTLRFEIVSSQGGTVPGKLTLVAVHGRRPHLGGRTGTELGGGVAAFNRVFSTSGAGEVRVRPGTYDVFASRGPEWSVDRQRVRVGAGDTFARFRIEPVVDTRGWLSADMHVHATRSTDSVAPMTARVRQLIADGVDLVVSTDHNTVSDYEPAITELGAHHLIGSARGDEITTKDWGHLVAFPLPSSVANLRRGAVLTRGRTGNDFTALVRSLEPESIIIAVHPHSRTSSYLRDGGLDTRRDRARRGFSWDFDAIEIVNGYHRYNLGGAIRRNLRTWFDLLDHGHLVAAVGSSDTHALRGLGGQGGYPRTYVRVPDDRPDVATVGDVVRALKAQRALLTTGPFVTARIGDHGIGDVAPAPNGRAVLDIDVQAAPWVSADELTIYLNGRVHLRLPIPASTEARRLRTSIELTVDRDAYVVVRVDGRGSLEPIVGEKKHHVPSLALTNPIYLDVDGNRRFDPPRRHGHPVVGRTQTGGHHSSSATSPPVSPAR